jgi:hypothetical protein
MLIQIRRSRASGPTPNEPIRRGTTFNNAEVSNYSTLNASRARCPCLKSA